MIWPNTKLQTFEVSLLLELSCGSQNENFVDNSESQCQRLAVAPQEGLKWNWLLGTQEGHELCCLPAAKCSQLLTS